MIVPLPVVIAPLLMAPPERMPTLPLFDTIEVPITAPARVARPALPAIVMAPLLLASVPAAITPAPNRLIAPPPLP